MIFALDLEGVLAPEIWPILGRSLRAARAVAHDPRPRRLRRADAPAGRGDPRARPHARASSRWSRTRWSPYLGARDFLARLRALGQVVIISDTFHEFSEPLVQKLGGHSLFANRFELDGGGVLRGFKLRIRGQKERIVSGFKSAGFPVAAMGDSLNDLSLLRTCDYPVLYRPVEALRREFPDSPLAQDLDHALTILQAAARREENGQQ